MTAILVKPHFRSSHHFDLRVPDIFAFGIDNIADGFSCLRNDLK